MVVDGVVPPHSADRRLCHRGSERCDLSAFVGGEIPPAYRRCRTYTDYWQAYQAVLPHHTHHPVGQETGQTAHQEAWYNTLRQRVARILAPSLNRSTPDRSSVQSARQAL